MGITFEVANIIGYDPVAVVFDVAWLAMRLFEATREGGRLLMCNTERGDDYLLLPPIIRTYRDLMLNVGYRLTAEDHFRGSKNGHELEALVSCYTKP